MRRSIVAAIALSTAVAAAGLAQSARAAHPHRHGGQDYPPRPGSTPAFVITLPTARPGAPPVGKTGTLSAAQKRAVRGIAMSNTLVKRLLHGKQYRILGTLPWKINGRLAGGLTQLGFSPAVTLSGRWLSGGKPLTATYRNVSRMSVYVDLGARKVTDIFPR